MMEVQFKIFFLSLTRKEYSRYLLYDGDGDDDDVDAFFFFKFSFFFCHIKFILPANI